MVKANPQSEKLWRMQEICNQVDFLKMVVYTAADFSNDVNTHLQ